jgi:hypothetical protein
VVASTIGGPQASGALPPPTLVVVQGFSVDPAAVLLDPGVAATFQRSASGESSQEAQQQVAYSAAGALTNALIRQLDQKGIQAVGPGTTMQQGPVVLVDGRVDAINQGNATRRRLIGFGAGQSGVQVTAQLSYLHPGGVLQPIRTIALSGDSGRKAGAAVGFGAGAAAGHVASAAALAGGRQAATYRQGSVEADAQAVAARLADEIGATFAQQGWPISAPPR